MYEKTNIKAVPIAIQTTNKVKNEQYSLINMRFDPAQNSPPSMWKMRLNTRIGIETPLKVSVQGWTIPA
jgi:hypothetical protein